MTYMKYTVTLESKYGYPEQGGNNAIVEAKLKEAILGVTKMITSDGEVSCGDGRLNGVGLVSVQRTPVTPVHFCPEPPKTWIQQIDSQLQQNEIDKLRLLQVVAEAQDNLRWIAKRDKALLKEYRLHAATEKRLKKLGIKSETDQLNKGVHPDHQIKAVRKPRKIVK
jgi:hypothetical protein